MITRDFRSPLSGIPVFADPLDPNHFYLAPAQLSVSDDSKPLDGVAAGGNAWVALTLRASPSPADLAAARAQLPPAATLDVLPFSGPVELLIDPRGTSLGYSELEPIGGGEYAALFQFPRAGAQPVVPDGSRLTLSAACQGEYRQRGVSLSVDGDPRAIADLLACLARDDPPPWASPRGMVELLLRVQALTVRVAAGSAPVDGAAHEALVDLLVERLGSGFEQWAAPGQLPPDSLRAFPADFLRFDVTDGARMTHPWGASGSPGRAIALREGAVLVRAPVDFARLGIAAVELHLQDEKGAQDIRLTSGRDVLIVPLGDRYDWSGTVRYAGRPDTLAIGGRGAVARALRFDAEALGVLDVAVGLDLDERHFTRAQVSLRYAGGRGAETQLALDADHPDATWTAAVGEPVTGGLQGRAEWSDAAGAVTSVDLPDDQRSSVRLSEPPFPGLDVRLTLPPWAFLDDQVAQLALELRHGDSTASFVLTRTNPSLRWQLPLAAGAPRDYQASATLFMRDGTMRRDDWMDGAQIFWPEGRALELFSRVDWSGPGAPTLAEVAITMRGPRGDQHATTVVSSSPSRTTFATTNGFAGNFTIDVTYYDHAGAARKMPTVTSVNDVVVLPEPV
jgi:hypothetical protein